MSFWQKVQRGVTQGAKQAAAEATKQTTIARKTLELNGVRGDIRRKINELGDEALALHRTSAIQHEKLDVIVKEIDVLEAKSSTLEREIAEAKDDSGEPAAKVEEVEPAAKAETAQPAAKAETAQPAAPAVE